jgi:hypothetical protein
VSFGSFHEALDKKYYYGAPGYPRYSMVDAEKLAMANASKPCDERLTMGGLWKKLNLLYAGAARRRSY